MEKIFTNTPLFGSVSHTPSSRSVSVRDIGRFFIPRTTTLRGDERGVKGFTLIELLVVVLIIGILAAVALPRYNRAVAKSRATQGLTMLKNVYEAAEVYYMANGTWPTSFDELDVQIPWTGHEAFSVSMLDPRSNGTWSIGIENTEASQNIKIGYLNGPYANCGFYMLRKYDYSTNIPLRTPVCVEYTGANAGVHSFTGEAGDFCVKLFNATLVSTGAVVAYYKMP